MILVNLYLKMRKYIKNESNDIIVVSNFHLISQNNNDINLKELSKIFSDLYLIQKQSLIQIYKNKKYLHFKVNK